MLQTILGANQAKEARENLGLSQGKVATDLQFNRSYLSQFESGKRLFVDEDLKRLRDYYENQGYEFVDTPTLETNGIRAMDGFAVPHSVSTEEADNILTEYAENSEHIRRLASEEIGTSLFFGDVDEKDREQKTRRLLCLMARNYSLIEQLHGHETIMPCDSYETEEEGNTAGEFLGLEFGKLFGLGSDEPEVHEE